MNTSDATSRFLNRSAARKWSPKTRESYSWAFGYLSHTELPEDTEILELLLGVAADHLSEASLHDVWRRWRTLYRWASRRLEISNPIERIDAASGHIHFLLEKPRVPESFPRILSHEQVQGLLHEGCVNRRDQLMVLIPLDMGLRLSEIANLSKDSLSSEGVRIKGKGNKTRIVPISRELCRELENTGSLEHIWIGKKQNPVAPEGVKSAFRRIFHRAGIKDGPHSLRHTFATQYPRRGGKIWALQRILGHSRVSTTEIYTHLVIDDVIRDHRQVSPIQEWVTPMNRLL